MLALFIILVSLTMTLFSEKVLIFNRCISGLMSNLIKIYWTVSIAWSVSSLNRKWLQFQPQLGSLKRLVAFFNLYVVEWWKELFFSLFSGNWKLARIELSGHIRESFRRHPLWNQWVKKLDRFAFESEFDWIFAGFNRWPAKIDYFQNWPKSFSRPQP